MGRTNNGLLGLEVTVIFFRASNDGRGAASVGAAFITRPSPHVHGPHQLRQRSGWAQFPLLLVFRLVHPALRVPWVFAARPRAAWPGPDLRPLRGLRRRAGHLSVGTDAARSLRGSAPGRPRGGRARGACGPDRASLRERWWLLLPRRRQQHHHRPPMASYSPTPPPHARQ